MNNEREKKLAILDDLFVSEEHTLEELQEIVQYAKPFISIEPSRAQIYFSHDYGFTVLEKVALFLVGRYFLQDVDIDKDTINSSRFIADSLDIAQTTISGPLGELVRKNTVTKENDGYRIKFYKVKELLDMLTKKYITNESGQRKKSSLKKITKTRISRSKKKSAKAQNPTELELQQYTFDESHKETILEHHSISKEDLDSIFSFRGKSLFLLRGYSNGSNTERQVRSALLVLTAYSIYFNSDTIPSSKLRSILQHTGNDLSNFSTLIKKYQTLIRHNRGPIGSTNTSYTLTPLGFQKGLALIKDLVNNTSSFDVKFSKHGKSGKFSPATPIKINPETLEKNLEEFARLQDINLELLRTKIDFQPESVRIIDLPKHKTRKIMQIKCLMLLGVLVKNVYQIDNFDGTRILKDSFVNKDRLDLLYTNKYFKRFFARKPKSCMELTYGGQKYALEMLKEYLKTGDFKLRG